MSPVITRERSRRAGEKEELRPTGAAEDPQRAGAGEEIRQAAQDAPWPLRPPRVGDVAPARDTGRDTVVAARGVTKRYGEGGAAVEALRGADVDLRRSEFTAIMGPSGSGKSTLMHILAGLDRPTAGTIAIDGREIGGLKDRDLTKLRRDKVGFIFQSFNLLPTLTAAENIALPLTISGRRIDGRWFAELVETVGLGDRLNHRPAELSGGQQQRVAVARALVSRPAVLFADEPTGNLDSHTGDEVLQLLRRSVDDLGQTIIMVTHDAHAAATADRVLFLKDGEIVHDRGRMTRGEIYDVMKSLEVRR